MKKLLLTFGTFVLLSFGMHATTTNNYYNNNGKSFTFVENGITYSIFQNGEFDFYINQRNGLQVNYNTNNVNISFNSGYNYDAYVQYDRYGAVIQVENTPIYYDYYGRVTQVGNININYNNGRLVRLGGLRVYYNSYGNYAYYRGYINTNNRHYVYHPYHNYFARPYYDYRIVSYKPYRHHYKANRYAYHRDHSKNKYYSNHHKKGNYKGSHSKYDKRSKDYGKRNTESARRRVATHEVPKQQRNTVAQETRRSSNATNLFKNERSSYENVRQHSSRSTASISRTQDIRKKQETSVKRVPARTNERSVQNSKRVDQRKVAPKRDATRKPEANAKRGTSTSKRTVVATKDTKTPQRRGTSKTIRGSKI